MRMLQRDDPETVARAFAEELQNECADAAMVGFFLG